MRVLGGGGVPTYYHCAFTRQCQQTHTRATLEIANYKRKIRFFGLRSAVTKKRHSNADAMFWIFLDFFGSFLEARAVYIHRFWIIFGSFLDPFTGAPLGFAFPEYMASVWASFGPRFGTASGGVPRMYHLGFGSY